MGTQVVAGQIGRRKSGFIISLTQILLWAKYCFIISFILKGGVSSLNLINILKLSVTNTISFTVKVTSHTNVIHFLFNRELHIDFMFIFHICLYRCIGYFEQYVEYDPFFTAPELPNPWTSDSPEFWEQEKTA